MSAGAGGWTAGPWRVSGDTLPECNIVENEEGDFIAQTIDARGFASLDSVGCARLIAAAPELASAAADALSGWRYIRKHHGDLPGVGWDRVEQALSAALARARTTEAAS